MSGTKGRVGDNGSGGSSDGDIQPDDTGANGTLADHPTANKRVTNVGSGGPPDREERIGNKRVCGRAPARGLRSTLRRPSLTDVMV